MKTFKKTTRLPSFINHKPFNVFTVLIALILLFSISGFISVNENRSGDLMMPGVVFEIEVTDHEQSPPRTSEMEVVVEGRNLKMDILPGDGARGKGKMIFRGDKGENGEVVIVDDDKKEYYVMDDAFAKSMKGKIDQSKSMMDEAMKNLTKEQLDMIKKAQEKSGGKMPGIMKPQSKPEVRNTGERGTKAGYPCVKYEVLLDGRKIRELWVTDWSNIDGGGEAEDAFKAMKKFFEKFMDGIDDMLGGGVNPYDDKFFDKGFPVVTKNFKDDGSLEDESWLKRTRRQHIDPDAFEPPSGYKRMSMGPN